MFKSDVGVIKFIVISLAETDIQTAFRDKLEVFAEGDNVTKDIELHVRAVLQEYIEEDPEWLEDSAEEMKSLISSTLVKKANGMLV